MKIWSQLVLALGLVSLWAGISSAAPVPGFRVGRPTYSGTGCPPGTLSISFAPDNLSISVLFTSFITSVVKSPGVAWNAVNCNVFVPMTLPKGLQLVIRRVDYRGFVMTPPRGLSTFTGQYSFWSPGQTMPNLAKMQAHFTNANDGDYFVSSASLGSKAIIKSACGGEVTLGMLESLWMYHNANGGDGQIVLDSADLAARSVFHINWQKCR